jgi:hypothetical protein
VPLAFIQFVDPNERVDIDNSLPPPPGHASGQPVPGGGGHPSGQPVPGGGRPDNSLPGMPARPDQGLPPGATTKPVPVPPGDNTIPPGAVWPPIEAGTKPGVDVGERVGDGKFYVMVWVPGVGPRWTCIDTNLKPGNALPGGPPAHASGQPVPGGGGHPDQGLPPAGARPDQGLPPAGARPDQDLPNAPARPDQGGPRPPHVSGQPVPGQPPQAGQQPTQPQPEQQRSDRGSDRNPRR